MSMAMPGTERTREEAKRDTRVALIQAGLAEFAERGLDTPSLDAICARAGYTRGAFYVHFRNREDFIVAVMESVLGGFLDAILGDDVPASSGSESRGGLEETVLRFARALIQGNPLTGERGSMRTHHLLDVCSRSETIRRRFLTMLSESESRLAAAATAGQQEGTVRDDVSAASLAALLAALAMGIVQLFELGAPLEIEDVRAAVVRILAPT
jgi:TetR/AcrR family transcriptional repressor of nem operon